MSMYRDWGLREVINARGHNTALGSAVMAPEVTAAMVEASTAHVLMSELGDYASTVIARATGAEAGCVTSGAAAGVAISIAACMTGTDLIRIERLPDTQAFPKNEVVIQRGHLNKYMLMIQMTGARIVPFGYINGPGWTTEEQLRGTITDRTAAVFQVLGGHRHHKGELDLAATIRAAHARAVPVVVDAASMPDLRAYVGMGADLVTYSGGKSLLGPGSSGLIAGGAALIKACRRQDWGLARPMKVSKEETVGLIAALERYAALDHAALWRGWRAKCDALAAKLGGLPHVEIRVLDRDDAGEPAAFVQLAINERALGRTATEVNEALLRGNPTIRIRDYQAYVGVLELDVRTLFPAQEQTLIDRLRQALTAPAAARAAGGDPR